MFKKYAKNFLEKEVSLPHNTATLPESSFFDTHEEVTTLIAEEVTIKGELTFTTSLRIDGIFEGDLISSGTLIVGPTGFVKANINLQEAFISGTVEGDITVTERLVLRGRASITGNITAPIISVDEGVSIVGQMRIASAPAAPQTPDEPTTLVF
ncbi:MAG TPA: polymer-forming cytoskeletal protein [Rhabdochlamydiaceae bacterium]